MGKQINLGIRKVVRISHSYWVSLPSAWVKYNEIHKGMFMKIILSEDKKSLILKIS